MIVFLKQFSIPVACANDRYNLMQYVDPMVLRLRGIYR